MADAKADQTGSNPPDGAKQRFLDAYEEEHETTMKVLRSYPEDRLDLRPHEKCKTARELAWVFVLERQLGTMVFQDGFDPEMASGEPPAPPGKWSDLFDALQESHRDFGDLVRSTPEEDLSRTVSFYTAPQTIGEIPRLDWLWFLLHDQIHHRGQFSVYLRMADGRVPSIYGPSADEPWI